MADICTCCGKKIPFLDVDYDYIEIDKVEYRLCGKCRSKINAYSMVIFRLKKLLLTQRMKKLPITYKT